MSTFSLKERKSFNVEEDLTSDSYSKQDLRTPWSFLTKISAFLESMGVEQRGIHRIQPHERGTKREQFISAIGFWLSAAGGLTTLSSFVLASTVYNLSFRQACICGIIGQFLGCAIAAYCSTMGSRSGCRQMVTARYLFGWWFVKFVSLIGCLGGTGWSIVNCVLGGQILTAISDSRVPLWVGILIVAAVTLVVALFGIKLVLRFEKYLAVPVFITFVLIYISASDKYHLLATYHNDLDATTYKGNWLSFFSLTYSVTATWGTVCSDYYIQFPENTPGYQTFILTFLGIGIPSTFVAVFGLILSTLAMVDEDYSTAYALYGTGGLLEQAFSRWGGFGKFCVVIMLFSLVSNNICNTYSSAFAFQLLGRFFAKIPRWIWVLVITAIYFCCSIAGRYHFSDFLGNFLPMIGYWISMYFFLLLEENVIFREHFHHLYTKEFPPGQDDKVDELTPSHKKAKRQLYNWDAWNDPSILSHGFAGGFAFCCGIAGAVLGMAQLYYVGPIAAKFGEYGGDLGMWLSMGFCGVTYPLLRYIELKKFGR